MRVLLINPKADFSFWTLPVALRLTGTKTLAPPLGLITVAALLPREWELRLADLNARPMTETDWKWGDLVMMSGTFAQRASFLAVVKQAKARGKTIVCGGPYPTWLSEELFDAGADFVVKGEGENTVPVLLEALKKGSKGGTFENIEKPDITLSPVPRFDLLRTQDYQFLTIQTSRGCPFNCEFCDITSLFGRKPRYKTPGQAMAELEELYRLGWRSGVLVADDNFIGNKTHARAILRELIPWQGARGEPFGFFTQTSLNLGEDTELIDLMTAANFYHVFVGIESPDTRALEVSRKSQNVRISMREAIANINGNGLNIQGSFIVGLDGEGKGIGQRIAAFVEESNIPLAMINLLAALPGTDLWERLEKQGRLIYHKVVAEDMVGDYTNVVPDRPLSEVLDEFASAWEQIYEPSRFLARVHRWFSNMRPTRRAVAKSRGEKPPPRKSPRRFSMTRTLRELKGLILLVWLMGIQPPYRRQFWTQLSSMARINPSRLRSYLIWCAMGLDMFRIREMLLTKRSNHRAGIGQGREEATNSKHARAVP